MPKCHQPLKFNDLNTFLTKFCDNYQRHDYSSCLQWHSNMSPHFTNSEVKKKHLRRTPVINTPNGIVLAYENEKCPNPDTCPDKSACKKCHNEKEFMYHPLVYMTAKCNNGPSCKNRSRFCAFYHTETERVESERNREELLRKLNRHKNISKRAVSPTSQSPPSKWSSDNISLTSPPLDIKQKGTQTEKSPRFSDSRESTRRASAEEEIRGNSNSIIQRTYSDENSVSADSKSRKQLEEPFRFVAPNGGNTRTETSNGQIHNSQYSPTYPLGNLREGNTNTNGNGYGRYHATSSSQYTPGKPNIPYNVPKIAMISENLHLFPQKVISQRSDGIIYEGVFLDHGVECPVAVKEVEFRLLGTDELSRNNVMSLQHRNIVRYHTVCYKNDRAYIVMELHTKSLATFLREDRSRIQSSDHVLTPICKSLLQQLCSTVSYLQVEEQITHCDLLLDNIFIEEERDNNYRVIIGDRNRTRVRQQLPVDSYSALDSDDEILYRYVLPKEWTSPEENTLPQLTNNQMYQSDMWRLGMLIFYILTGEPYNPDNTPKFHINAQPWSSLSSALLQTDYMLRLSTKGLLHHPVFWYYLPSRVTEFYKQIFRQINDIGPLLSSIESNTFLYPHTDWVSVVVQQNNFQQYENNGSSVLRLIKLIMDTITQNQLKDEYYSAVIAQCQRQRIVDPVAFFQQNFPCLIFKIWELCFQEKKRLEKQQKLFTELLSH